MKNKFNKFFKKISSNKIIFIVILLLFCGLYLGTKRSSYAEFTSKFPNAGHSSGITGLTNTDVILDDLKADWYYYTSLNFTDTDGADVPTAFNKNTYTKNNLVQTKVTYSGTDIDDNLTGYVSVSERQYKYVYYKVYPVNDNGTSTTDDDYIEIELIDNPFTDRPNNTGFNGWVTSYEGAITSFDKVYYTRYAKVPVTYTNGNPDTIEITFNASWVTANVYTISGNVNWSNAFAALNPAGMASISLDENTTTAGYYKAITIANGDSIVGYYDASGVYQSSGTCNTNGGCTYYELIQYYDNNNNPNVSDGVTTYYYLVTRDTNIVVVNANISSIWSSSQNKPFTLTGAYNGTNYNRRWTVSNIVVKCYNDTVIENIQLYTTTGMASDTYTTATGSSSGNFYGNNFNTKIGRGITRNGSNVTFSTAFGGGNSSTGSSANPTKYKTIVEQGFFSTLTPTGADTSTHYVKALGVYGNDYDRANNDNSKLMVSYQFSTMFGGTYSLSNTNDYAVISRIKSGRYGTNEVNYYAGIYVSMPDTKNGKNPGTANVRKKVIFEGGDVYIVNGGTGATSARENVNDTFFYMTGGTADLIFGGAGAVETYGNRIVCVIGGTVNFSVLGGSNGYEAHNGQGTIDGSSYTYVGGTAVIGNPSYVSNSTKLYNIESGSVFGVGNGTTRAHNKFDAIGTSYNSIVILNDEANILNNVYGGGNIASVGIESSGSSTYTNIGIYGSTVNGSVFGSGNLHGSGTSSITSNISINMAGGEILGSLYGGPNETGDVYGDVTMSIVGGTIEGDVFGGGLGGGTDGTFIRDDIEIVIGDENASTSPTINGGVYGGSAYGTVNGLIATGTLSSSNTTVTVNAGNVNQVFGGGMGDSSYTPYVEGNVLVVVNGGNVTDLFGGNDEAGTPNGTVTVRLKGGNIANAYGGGNKTSVPTTNMYLEGANAGNVFGGSNQTGNVNVSNVTATSGSAVNIYAGNNEGGVVTTTNLLIDGATVTGSAYGGGNLVDTTTAVVIVDSGNVNNLFGGGNSASLTNPSDITINGGSTSNIYGGSNQIGDVPYSNIVVNDGTVGNIYGANNHGGSTNVTYIKLYGGNITGSVYGGGNEAASEHPHIEVNGATVNTIYGGGNQAGVIDSDIKLIDGTVTNVYGGSNQLGNVSESNIYTEVKTGGTQNLVVTNIYGGNNQGGKTSKANITLELGEITNIYGGGNLAPVDSAEVLCSDITIHGVLYGGGNRAAVNNDTNLKLVNVSIGDSIFGGGNAGEVLGNTNVYITSCDIDKSVYAGGNGSTATVYGRTLLYIDGATEIGEHVFGGGNAAATGDATLNNSSSEVNIAGATIGGNVYGGANTSVINGISNLYIGYDTIQNNSSLIKGDIVIDGTVFGGGEANASGSTEYDFSFISVTNGINILIDGNGHDNFDINGSIFGSGNASSSGGYSYIDIYNYGTSDDVKLNVSLQRADRVTINNSHIEFIGAKDRTNEYADELFAISRVDELKIKNNTTLYLRNGGNLLKHLISAVDVNGTETLSTVDIDSENKTITKNVDNRIYILEGKVLNIATNENINAYGEVDGMSFLGIYQVGRDGTPESSLYGTDYTFDTSVGSSEMYYFNNGCYVLGLHETPIHDIQVDGFYSNFIEEETPDRITVKYIDPTPEDSNFYMWTIGEQVSSYEMTLTASKYLTLGTEELAFSRHTNPNTTFTIVGFNYNDLNPNVNLVREDDVPRIAASEDDADNNMSLVMKSGISGWMTNGNTTFLSSDTQPIVGTLDYRGENASYVPTLQFYLYHSKNLGSSGDMGSVTISMLVITPLTDLTSKVERVNIIITLKRALYNTNDYEGAITPGKKYGLFTSNAVNLTSNGSFSAYYSLFVESDETIYKTGYHRALISSYAFPANTKITMIDYSDHDNPEYYYYVVNNSDYNAALTQLSLNNEVAYTLDKFIKMGSTSVPNNYDEAAANSRYYDSHSDYAQEEFIFIVDFGEANITSDVTGESILFELRDNNDETRISVLGIQQELMNYNLYTNKNAVIGLDASIEKNSIHPGDTVNLIVTTNYVQNTIRGNLIHDTSYFDKQLGIKITIFDSENNQVTGVSLLGVTYGLDNVKYYPRVDGTTRINISENVTNVSSRIKFNTTDSLAAGTYTMKIESFGSWDGIYYGIESSDSAEVSFTVLDTVYGLKVTTNEKNVIVNKDTGKTLNDNNIIVLNYKYSSNLSHPNMHISLMRRDYDSIYSTDYEYVDFADYFVNEFDLSNVSNEYILSNNAANNTNIFLYLKDNLVSGTYRIVLSLYDGDSFIGDDYQYIIIK